MTPEALAAIAARNAARTQGTWKQHLVDDTTVVCGEKMICCTFPEGGLDDEVDFNTDTEQRENDAAFIAHAGEDIPSLLAEIARLTAALADAQNEAIRLEAERAVEWLSGYDAAKEQAMQQVRYDCRACSGTGHADAETECEYCGRPMQSIAAMVRP